jgi:hypothetical protein
VVVEGAPRQAPQHGRHGPVRLQPLAGGGDLPQRRKLLVIGEQLRELGEDDHREDRLLDLLLHEQRGQRGHVAAQLFRDHHQGAAGAPAGEHLVEAGVEAQGGELQGRHAAQEGRQMPVDQVAQSPVGEGHPLGLTRRARGVDHIGEGIRRKRPQGPKGPKGRKGLQVVIEQDDDGASGGQPVAQVLLGQQHRGAGIVEHERQPLLGVAWIERHIGASGLEDAEHAHDHVQGALDEQADQDVRADAEAAQALGEAAGAGTELGIGQRCGPEDHGDGLRRPECLLLEQIVDAAGESCSSGVVPVQAELVALRLREQRQLRGRQLRVCQSRGQEALEVSDQAVDGRAVEQIGGELDRTGQPAFPLLEGEREIELRRRPGHVRRPQAQARDLQVLDGNILQHQHHLEQGCLGEAPLRRELLDELFEGHVLVRMGDQRGLAGPAEQLPERGVPGEVRAQHQRVDEEPDQALDLHPVASGDG